MNSGLSLRERTMQPYPRTLRSSVFLKLARKPCECIHLPLVGVQEVFHFRCLAFAAAIANIITDVAPVLASLADAVVSVANRR